MNSLYRALYFRTFVLFFLIILPFLILFTLGYDISLNKSGLSQSLVISIETLPRDSKVIENNKTIGNTPAEVRGENNVPITLNVTQNNYFPEKFIFFSASNTVANISNLALLPQTPIILSKNPTSQTLVTILNDSVVLVKEDNKFYIKNYTFGGIENNQIPINNSENVNLLNNYFVDLGGAYYFYDSQVLLISKDEKWIFKDLKKLPLKVVKIVKKNTSFLIQTDNSQLWSYDSETNLLKFIESGIFGISKNINSDFIWILKGSEVYRIDSSNDLNFQFTVNRQYYNFDIIKKLDNSLSSFDVKSVFQGIVLKYNTDIIYIPDFDTKQSVLITNNAESFEAFGSSVFWLSDNGSLFSNNLELKSEVIIDKIPLKSESIEKVKISYYIPWKRLFVYSDDKVNTVWFDKSVLNSSILKYFSYSFSGGDCLVGITEKNQFCIEGNKLVSYRNTKIW